MKRPRSDRLVQLDVEDPARERIVQKKDRTERRLPLNNAERAIIIRKQTIDKALTLFVEKSMSMPDVSDEIGVEQSALARAVTDGGHPGLRDAVINRAIERYLDLDSPHTRKKIAEELGMSTLQLYHLTKSDDFIHAYNEHFLDLLSDPTIKAVRHKLVEELLPQAFQTLGYVMTNGTDSTKLRAAMEVMRLAGVRPVDVKDTDRKEATRFLTEKGLQVNVGVINIPQDYQDAIDASFTDISPEDTALLPETEQEPEE